MTVLTPTRIFRFASHARVSSTFESGFSSSTADGWWSIGRAHSPGGAGRIWEVRVEELGRAASLAEALRARLGEGYLVLDWRQLYRSLFTALELLQRTLFVLLGLIVLVATFNVASTVVVLVRERRRDFGVLAAIRCRPDAARHSSGRRAASAGGAVIGLTLAATIAALATRFELLSLTKPGGAPARSRSGWRRPTRSRSHSSRSW
jgi:hypothetical protein